MCVIGAGVGSLLALDLGHRGIEVVLVDERRVILGGASSSQLARLHLGPHYSGDDRFAPDRLNTAQRCTLGAVAWLRRYPEVAPTRSRWWQLITTDSMTSADDYLTFCGRLAAYQDDRAQHDTVARRLLGPPDGLMRVLGTDEYSPHVAPDRVVLGVETPERVIDLGALRCSIERDLAGSPRIDVRLSTRVRSVRRAAEAGFVVHLENGERLAVDLVVNCSGHDLYALDAADPPAPGPMSTRLRFVATAALPDRLRPVPSMFFHRGVLGNHTRLDATTMRFVSEPICNFRTVTGVGVPEAWRRLMMHPEDPTCWVDGIRAALALPGTSEPGGRSPRPDTLTGELSGALSGDRGQVGVDLHDRIAAAIVDGYAELVPAIRDGGRVVVTPMASLDLGHTDIWEPSGSVHRRDWAIRVDDAGLVTVYPGKFTFGALAVDEAVTQVMALLAGERTPGSRVLVGEPASAS